MTRISSKVSEKDKENKEEFVKEIKKSIKILSKYKRTEGYIKYLLLSILDLNCARNCFELDTFIEYIKLPLKNKNYMYNISKKSKKKN